jgi:hypothetical protein
MIHVETVPGMGEGGKKENSGGVNSGMMYLKHYKNFCKCHNVPPAIKTIKNIVIMGNYSIHLFKNNFI